MGNSQSKNCEPCYKTAAISGTAGGMIGAAAVCAFIFSLPISVSALLIGGGSGLIASVAVEHFYPSQSIQNAILKGGIVGFIAGGTTYYLSVKLMPDVVLSEKQLNVIADRAKDIINNKPNIKPVERIWNADAPTYLEKYKIKDPKTGYLMEINKQRDAIKITEKYNPVFCEEIDLNHTYLEITDGKETFITELTKNKDAFAKTGGVVLPDETRDGTTFCTYYADPNKCRTIEEAKYLVSDVKGHWDENIVYNTGNATCQQYSQDVIHVLTGKSNGSIPRKEKNTFKVIQTIDTITLNTFNANTVQTHINKTNYLKNINGFKQKLPKNISFDNGSSTVGTVIAVSGMAIGAGVATYKSVASRNAKNKVPQQLIVRN